MTDGPAPTLGEYLASKYRAGSAEQYAYRIGRYVAHAGEAAAGSATYGDVLAYVAELRRRGLHAKTLRLELQAVKAYYTWLVKIGQRPDHPCRTMRLGDRVDRQIRVDELYTAEQIEAWASSYKAAKADDQRRGEVIIGLLVNQAMTAGDIARLRVGDVDLAAGTVYVGAGGKTAERTLGLRASQVLTLWRYVERDRGRYVKMAEARGLRSDWLLLDTRGGQLVGAELHELVNVGRAKTERLRPQKVRQSVIAGLVAAGHELRVVQAFVAHRTSAATEQYKRSDHEELTEAVAKYHPRG